MGEFITPHDDRESYYETPENDLTQNSLEATFTQLKSEFGPERHGDPEAIEKINAIHSELEKLMAAEGISWDDHLESNERSTIRSKMVGHFASEDPEEIARDIIKYLKQQLN